MVYDFKFRHVPCHLEKKLLSSIKLVDTLRHEFHCACEIYKAVKDPCCIIILRQIFDYFPCRLDVA